MEKGILMGDINGVCICKARGFVPGNSGVHDTVVNSLMAKIDGVEQLNSLAWWSKCSLDSKVNDSLSADIKLETEDEDGTCNENIPTSLAQSIYHPRMALKNAIAEWLPEFSVAKEAWGPLVKPQPQVTIAHLSGNAYCSNNSIDQYVYELNDNHDNFKPIQNSIVPEVNTTQLQALAEVCSTVNSSAIIPISNPIMNSLISATKVIANDDILNPITPIAATNIELPKIIPISSVEIPIMHAKDQSSGPASIGTSKNEKPDQLICTDHPITEVTNKDKETDRNNTFDPEKHSDNKKVVVIRN